MKNGEKKNNRIIRMMDDYIIPPIQGDTKCLGQPTTYDR